MKKITISALIPNYNHAHYISIQLESMLSQKRPPDEIIIIDDASTDNSIEIIHDFMKKFDSIKLIKNKKNMGVEWNINKLIDEAKGSYIFLSAADDKTDKDFFYEVEIVAKEFPDIGVISGIVGIIDESGQCLGIRSMPLISSK
jgi:glycosyltransferase involved in cell wall biosynthesis